MSWRGFYGSSGSGRDGVAANDGRKRLLAARLVINDMANEGCVDQHAGSPEAAARGSGPKPTNRGVRALFLVASAFLMVGCPGPPNANSVTAEPCVELPRCSLGPPTLEASNPLSKQLGCGLQQRYRNGANLGVLGGDGSFCPDSPDNRKLLREHHRTGFLPGYCDTCLRVPAGQARRIRS